MSLPPNKRHLAQESTVVRDQCLVVDGGATGSAPIPRPSSCVLSGDKRPWIRLSIAGGDLHIIDCKDPHLGVSLVAPRRSPPPFIRLPRHASINRTGMDNLATSSRHCQLLKRAEGFSKKNLVRGATRHIFPHRTTCDLVLCPAGVPLAMGSAKSSQCCLKTTGLKCARRLLNMRNCIVHSSQLLK